MLEGLAETEQALRDRGLGFVIRLGSPDKTALTLAESAALVVCDRGYLRTQRQWHAHFGAKVGRRLIQVEGDVGVPVELASTQNRNRCAYAASETAALRDDSFGHCAANTRAREPSG
jgi:deoxyribodipyrimidine photo-lyase